MGFGQKVKNTQEGDWRAAQHKICFIINLSYLFFASVTGAWQDKTPQPHGLDSVNYPLSLSLSRRPFFVPLDQMTGACQVPQSEGANEAGGPVLWTLGCTPGLLRPDMGPHGGRESPANRQQQQEKGRSGISREVGMAQEERGGGGRRRNLDRGGCQAPKVRPGESECSCSITTRRAHRRRSDVGTGAKQQGDGGIPPSILFPKRNRERGDDRPVPSGTHT